MTPLQYFPPTLDAMRSRLDAVRPAEYARSRNWLSGAVTRLSPYVTHGFVTLPEVLADVAMRHPLQMQHKFVFELGWREYFRHVWQHRGDAILRPLHVGPLPESAYAHDLPDDIREARSGVPVIDHAVRALYTTGYLHNHARMWLASYVVHLRKVHWRAGADWMLGHLLDGDLASNHLSWQWVAGTGSHKPYLFNAANVERYAPDQWRSPGTAIDASYEALDALARTPQAVCNMSSRGGVDEPAWATVPASATPPNAAAITDRDVWLIHPWALADPPSDLPADRVCVAWWPSECFARWRWNAARFAFVEQRMTALATTQWRGTSTELVAALATARSVQTRADPHVDAWLPASVRRREVPTLFQPVGGPCASFSGWWKRSTHGVRRVADLPGLRHLAVQRSSGAECNA